MSGHDKNVTAIRRGSICIRLAAATLNKHLPPTGINQQIGEEVHRQVQRPVTAYKRPKSQKIIEKPVITAPLLRPSLKQPSFNREAVQKAREIIKKSSITDKIEQYRKQYLITEEEPDISYIHISGRPDFLFTGQGGTYHVVEVKTWFNRNYEFADKVQVEAYLYILDMSNLKARISGEILYVKNDFSRNVRLTPNGKRRIEGIDRSIDEVLDNPLETQLHRKERDFCERIGCKFISGCFQDDVMLEELADGGKVYLTR